MDLVPIKTQTARLLAEVEDVVTREPIEQQTWLQDLGHALTTWGDVADFSIMREAEILYYVHSVWENRDVAERLHPNSKLLWRGDFYRWANTFIKRRGVDQSATSIQNKIGVYKDFVSPKACIDLPETVYIPARDESGKPIPDPVEEEDWIEIEPDLDVVDYSKLLVIKGPAKERDLPCDVWSKVFDPATTVADVQAALREDKNGSGNGEDKFRFFYEDGIVYARENGFVEGVAQILDDDEVSPLFAAGVERLLKGVGIKETPILNEQVKHEINVLAWVSGEGLVIAASGGYRVGVYTREQAREMLEVLEAFVNGS